jgi:pimeloyl-ACP methyl ester carboxylesterase
LYVGDLVAWARKTEDLPGADYYLFGHSAGGQFLSRVAAYAPPRDARRIVIANPSSWVLPSLSETAPYGLAGAFPAREEQLRLRQYLAAPVTVLLGSNDTGARMLLRNEGAMRQGSNRLTRGRNTFNAAKTLAAAKQWTFAWRLVVVPQVGHDTSDLLDSPEAARAFGLKP